MRFLIHELSYETPVSAGQFRYYHQDQPTGAAESWRVTEAMDGYRILRVDLDARQAPSGESHLFHLIMNKVGRPERLTFRFFRFDLRIKGNLLFEQEQVTLSREVNGVRRDEEWAAEGDYYFFFPAATALSLLASLPADGSEQPALTLDKSADYALCPTTLSAESGAREEIILGGRSSLARPITIRWATQVRTFWLDELGWPVLVQRDALVARQTRHIRYGPQGGER